MSDFKKYSLEEQLKGLSIDIGNLTDEITARAKGAMALLQQQTYGLWVQKAQEKLKSTRQVYIDNLGMENDGSNLWVVYLGKPAGWIENGMPAGERIDMILNGGKPAKQGKNGRYKIIPFSHGGKPTNRSQAQQQIANFAQREIKARGLDKTIKLNGKPVIGRAATLNLTGPNAPVSKFNKPLLAGLTIYQKEVKMKNGKTKIKRDVMTFRVISESQKGSGLWEWKEMKGAHLFEEVLKEIDPMWDKLLADTIRQIKIESQP